MAADYFNMEDWRNCCDSSLSLEDFRGRECFEGIDLSERDDLTSCVLIFQEMRPTGPINPKTNAPRMERHYTVFGRHYSPHANIYDGSHKNYVGWHEAPERWLKSHEGVEVKLAYQCGRCGSSITFETCSNCAGDGYFEHDCFEDSCCCLDPEDDVCVTCNGEGVIPICLSSAEWCEAHPRPGRELTARSTPERFEVPDRPGRTLAVQA